MIIPFEYLMLTNGRAVCELDIIKNCEFIFNEPKIWPEIGDVCRRNSDFEMDNDTVDLCRTNIENKFENVVYRWIQ